MRAIYKREFLSYFTSPLGYIVLALYGALSGFFFWLICYQGAYNGLNVVVDRMLYVVFFLMPLITMRSLSEEKRQRTDQLLLTSPVKLSSIVIGKYLAAVTLFLICSLVYFFYAFVMILTVPGVTIVWGQLICAWLGVVFIGCALLAINLFYSSLTESQVIAAVLGLGTGLVFMLYEAIIGAVEGFIETLFSVNFEFAFIDKLSVTVHYVNFVRGVLSPVDVVYFLSFNALFLFFTVRVLDRKRWA